MTLFAIIIILACCLVQLKSFCSSLSSHVSIARYRPCNHLKMGGGPIRGDQLPSILNLIESSRQGLNPQNKESIIAMMNIVENQNAAFIQKDRSFRDKVSGKWELLWTTEKETLFFINKGLFGKKVTLVSQTIDFKTNQINNLIEFEDGREFSVLGKLSDDNIDKRRVNFEFTKASIKIPPIPKLSIPPIGKGWFDNIFCNDKYRLSRDVRGDYLVSRKIVD